MSDGEIARSYPCDDFVTAPTLRAWRGVRVEAPAEAVWPWVAQVRLAPYSYDWIDNLGRRSLLLKVVMRTSRWAAFGLSVGDLIMARRQLLNWKNLAERHHRQGAAAG